MNLFIDGLAILYMIINGVIGYGRGIVEELGRLIGLIFSIFIAISQVSYFSNLIQQKINIESWLAILISFITLFFSVILLGRIITRLFHIALLSKSNQWANNLLGFIFGVIKGFFIVTVFFWILIILPLDKWTNIIEYNSRIFQTGTQFRLKIVNTFGLEDPLFHSENYIKNLVQP